MAFRKIKEKWNRLSSKEKMLTILEYLAAFSSGFASAVIVGVILKILGG